MDLGLGSLVEKFEEYLGRRATFVLIALTAAAALVFCVKAIIVDAIIPVVEFVRGAAPNSIQSVIRSVLIGTTIGSISGGLFIIIARLAVRRILRTLNDRDERVSRLIEEVEERTKRHTETLDEAKRLTDKAQRVYDEAHETHEEAKKLERQAKKALAEIKSRGAGAKPDT